MGNDGEDMEGEGGRKCEASFWTIVPCLLKTTELGSLEDPCLLAVGLLVLTASLKSFCEEPSHANVHIIFTFSRNISGWKEERKSLPF